MVNNIFKLFIWGSGDMGRCCWAQFWLSIRRLYAPIGLEGLSTTSQLKYKNEKPKEPGCHKKILFSIPKTAKYLEKWHYYQIFRKRRWLDCQVLTYNKLCLRSLITKRQLKPRLPFYTMKGSSLHPHKFALLGNNLSSSEKVNSL